MGILPVSDVSIVVASMVEGMLLPTCPYLTAYCWMWWLLQDPPGGGLSPAAVIASYAAYPYAVHLPLLALHALHAFAILQVDGWGLFGSDVGLFKYKAVQASRPGMHHPHVGNEHFCFYLSIMGL